MNRAFIFPGQGSQIVGMGKDFYDNFTVAKDVFHRVDETLGYKLTNIIFDGPEKHLSLTTHAQPSLMAVSIAILKTIEQEFGKNIKELCNYVSGHSLGEYSALCAVSSISLEDTTKLLHIRAVSMQSVCDKNKGSMAACIGITYDMLDTIVNDAKLYGVCQIANYNMYNQIVVSGDYDAVYRVVDSVKHCGYLAKFLNVSGPFHSKLMKDVEFKMEKAIDEVNFYSPLIPVISNFTALVTNDVHIIKYNLKKQICGMVRWYDTLKLLESLHVTDIIEIGSGKVLSNMIKKSNLKFNIYSVNSINDLQNLRSLF